MNLDQLGQPARCSECGQLRESEALLYEGAELEPICLTCLEKLDPARAMLLKTIQKRRQSGA